MFIELPNFVKEVLIFDEILCVQDAGFENADGRCVGVFTMISSWAKLAFSLQ